MRPARIYVRRSNEEQSGYSPQAQERECRAFCATEQLQVARVYIDDGVSGTKRTRPALDQLVADARPGDVIVVHHFDRLSRDTAFLLDLVFLHLEPRNIIIRSVQGGIDPYSAVGKLVLTVQGGASAYHIDNLKREIKKGIREKAQQGGWVGGLPQGYSSAWDIDNKGVRVRGSGRATPDDDAPIIREIFERYASGVESTRSLAIDLNTRGFTSRGRYGRMPWTADQISAVLGNPFYIGLIRYRGQELPGAHEPLITRETWEQVAFIRERRNQGGGHMHGIRQLGLLSEFGRCEWCDEPLHWIRMGKTQRRYYVCRNKRKVGTCEAPSMPAEPIEHQALNWLRSLMIPPWLHEEVMAMIDQELAQEQGGQSVDRKAIEQSIRRLDRLYEVGAKSDTEWELERSVLQRQLEQTSAPTKQVIDMAQALAFLSNIDSLLEKNEASDQHALLATVVRAAWCVDHRLVAIKPAPAFGLLIQAVQALECTDVTPTGAGHTPVYLWDAWRVAA
jgi:site-specific DNA recombinase